MSLFTSVVAIGAILAVSGVRLERSTGGCIEVGRGDGGADRRRDVARLQARSMRWPL